MIYTMKLNLTKVKWYKTQIGIRFKIKINNMADQTCNWKLLDVLHTTRWYHVTHDGITHRSIISQYRLICIKSFPFVQHFPLKLFAKFTISNQIPIWRTFCYVLMNTNKNYRLCMDFACVIQIPYLLLLLL